MKHLTFILAFILSSIQFCGQMDSDSSASTAIWADETRTDEARVDDLIHQINLLWEKGQSITSRALIEKINDFEIGRTDPKYHTFYLLGTAVAYNRETDEQIELLLEGLEHAESIDYTFGISIAYVYLGINTEISGNDSLGLEYFKKSIEIAKDAEEFHLVMNKAWAETKIAMLLIRQGKDELALHYENEAALTYSKIKDRPALYYFFYYELGEVCQNVGHIDRAMAYYKKALPYMPAENPFLINRISYIYDKQGEWEKALNFYEQSFKKYMEINRLANAYAALFNKGRMLVKIGELNRARAVANEIYEIADQKDSLIEKSKSYTLLGLVADANGEDVKALEHFHAAKKTAEEEGNAGSWWIKINDLALGNNYMRQRDYAKAIDHCEECAPYFQEEAEYEELKLVYSTLHKSFKELGHHELALENLEKLVELTKDEQDPIETAKQLQQFEFAQKTLSDSLQQVEKFFKAELAHETALRQTNRTTYIAFGLGGLILLVSLGLWARLRHVRRTKLQLEEKNERIEEEKEKAKSSEEAKQRFLANMSHEIRTPMNAIKGMTDILIRREPKEVQMQYLNAIKESSSSLMVIINDILDFSKIEAGKIDLEKIPFSISQIVNNVCMIMRLRSDEKGLLLQNEVHESLPDHLIGDPTRLHQILLNLVGNAIKFTEKGVISIEVSPRSEDDQEDLWVEFNVTDTGVGIGQDRLDKIFDSFEQAYSDTTRKFGGTGLGLTISKKLVELQNGIISVESEKGKGTRFRFTIPYQMLEIQKEVEIVPVASNGKVNSLNGVKILLAEDNEFNAIVAKEELEDALIDVQVEVAENGAIAVEKARTGAYDLILMDVQMPVMNGHEATQKIRSLGSEKSNIPIIAMTANVLKDEVDLCLEVGMNDFISKPFDVDLLVTKIQEHVIRSKNEHT